MSGSMAPFRYHHITLCTGGAREDVAFHTELLGLKNVKRTLLYDGQTPIYHLYYGNPNGDPSTLVTTFPVRHLGKKATRGTGQFETVDLSVPEGAVRWWSDRLKDRGIDASVSERFGQRRIRFMHPGGVAYTLVEVAEDGRDPITVGGIPAEYALRGLYATTVSVRDEAHQAEFMQDGWGANEVARDGAFVRYALGRGGGSGRVVDAHIQPDVKQGSWTFAEGSVHHCAFETDDHEQQMGVKLHLEGMGFTDVSDVKDRGYFDSVYVRSPSGALFEATVSKPQGLAEDEPRESLGTGIMIAPQFEAQREAILAEMEPLPAPR